MGGGLRGYCKMGEDSAATVRWGEDSQALAADGRLIQEDVFWEAGQDHAMELNNL